ncbi:MAG: hypothetical protein ACW7DW_16650, partial [Paraglaciecola chathamensis]
TFTSLVRFAFTSVIVLYCCRFYSFYLFIMYSSWQLIPPFFSVHHCCSLLLLVIAASVRTACVIFDAMQ